MKKLVLVSAACMALLPMSVFARGHVGIFVGPAFAPYGFYGYGYGYGYGGFGPYGMAPFGPSFGIPNAGVVRLDTKVKAAEVFIDGNFAGTAGQLKSMTMRAGDYTIEVREPGRVPFDEAIHVVAGKTLTLHPDFPVQAPVAPTGS